ncbi:MAG TPA: TonB-dependent receptor [Pyrinomonadaceae bacterium]|nr:TonB-dependent receptor [Pyrinomonadaceae bacterium]
MNIKRLLSSFVLIVLSVAAAHAAVFGDVRGSVLDPHQHPIAAAKITLLSRSSSFSLTSQTDGVGNFSFRAVPIGEYMVTVESGGFSKFTLAVTVLSDRTTALSVQLKIAPVSQQVEVRGGPGAVDSDSATLVTLVSRKQIAQTPGADRTNSLAMITDYVPGAVITHNQLHIRGGHQVTWLVDGVPVPNTNIADTVGPQFDPKDVDYLEVQRGSYTAEYGDRTYAMFNVMPRSGFERDREAELLVSYGNFNQTNEQLSFGDHTKRFAYYASVNGNRSDYGLETPVRQVLHDQSNGFGGFASLIFNANPKDQFRLVTALRRDFFQVPNDQDAQGAGIRDVERERDAFINFSWMRTLNDKLLLTLSPFYHYNRAAFIGGLNDTPVIPTDERSSHYGGAQIVLSALTRQHNAKIGFYGFLQRDDAFFRLQGDDGNGNPINLQQRQNPHGSLAAFFVEDQYKPLSWLTLSGGLRFTRFQGSLTENATSPRAGVAIRIPRVNLVLHGFYGRFYQAPPLSTLSGSLLQFALAQGVDFIPLSGERDEEYQFGATLPIKGWAIDGGYFHTAAKNFFDHDALGDSNIFFPLTIERARIRAFELSARSPQLFKRGQFYLAYSHQYAQGQGAVTGGLTDFSPPADLFFLDHDQRDTLSTGVTINLPSHSYVSGNVRYGSGFLDGDGPDHLPGHTTFDVSFGKGLGEYWSLALQTVNLTNNRFLLDSANTFGGTHFAEPRQIYVEVKYRFHY